MSFALLGAVGDQAGAGAAAYEPIATSAFSGSTVTFSAIPQTYADLRLVFKGALDTSASTYRFQVRINGHSDARYHWNSNYQNSTSASADGSAGGTSITAGEQNPGDTLPYIAIADIFAYAATDQAGAFGVSCFGVTPPTDSSWSKVGITWFKHEETHTAVTSITCGDIASGNTPPAGSTVTLYGIGSAY
jgi:hypothetical protein